MGENIGGKTQILTSRAVRDKKRLAENISRRDKGTDVQNHYDGERKKDNPRKLSQSANFGRTHKRECKYGKKD